MPLGIVSKHCLCCSSLGKLRPEGKKCFLSRSFLASHPQLMVEGSLVHQVPLHWRSNAQLADLPPPFSSEEQDGPAGGQQPHLHIPALSPAHTCSAEELFAKCRQIRSDKH